MCGLVCPKRTTSGGEGDCLKEGGVSGEKNGSACSVCQSPVRTVYSTANHVTRNEFCAVAREDDLLKVQLDEA